MKKMVTGSDKLHEKWTVLTEEEQFQEILEASEQHPQLVFKHSHRCSICIMAKEEVEEHFDALNEKAGMNFVNVVNARPVSNAITKQTGVRHESPQVLIIKEGEVVWHDSHHSIGADAILEALSNHTNSAK